MVPVGGQMARLASGEKFTTMCISKEVADIAREKKGGLSWDDYLRKLLKLPLKHRQKGRPMKEVAKKGKKAKTKK